MIKQSKKLDGLMDKIYKLCKENNCVLHTFIYDINSDFFIITNEDQCFVDLYVENGIYLVNKSIQTKKSIYRVHNITRDVILYFVDDVRNITKRLSAKLKELQLEANILSEDNKIKKLEKELRVLRGKSQLR